MAREVVSCFTFVSHRTHTSGNVGYMYCSALSCIANVPREKILIHLSPRAARLQIGSTDGRAVQTSKGGTETQNVSSSVRNIGHERVAMQGEMLQVFQ